MYPIDLSTIKDSEVFKYYAEKFDYPTGDEEQDKLLEERIIQLIINNPAIALA